MFKPELNTLEACHRLALIEGQKENQKRRDKKMEMPKFKLAFAVVLICLCVSVGLNLIQFLWTEHSPKTFIFTWTHKEKEYRMTLTFDTVPTLTGANLSITAKINADVFGYKNNFDLLFDLDGDGEFKKWDPAYILYNDNTMHQGLLDEGWIIAIPDCVPQPSPYHTCVFDNDTGYTFKINFPLEELKLKNDLIYVTYGYFYTDFHFDPEGELFK
jgi:hypothetical protein